MRSSPIGRLRWLTAGYVGCIWAGNQLGNASWHGKYVRRKYKISCWKRCEEFFCYVFPGLEFGPKTSFPKTTQDGGPVPV